MTPASVPDPSTPSPGPAPGHGLAEYALALVGTVAAVVVAALAERWFGMADLSSLFMLAVLVVAARTRAGPAVLAAVLCFLAYNYFFIEPRFTLYIGARHGLATVLVFLAAALLAGRLAAAADEEAMVQAADAAFREAFDAEAWVRLDAPTRPGRRGAHGVLHQGADARPQETIEQYGWWFLPLRAAGETLGVIGLKVPGDDGLDEAQKALARAMADDVGQALLRTRLVADLAAERVTGESERLRNELLSSVSHDLRSPLAAIIGAAESLERYGAAMDEADRRALLETVREEGQRLDRYIRNLLDMTRLGHGKLALKRDWIGVDELVGSAIGRVQRNRAGTRFAVSIAGDAGTVWVHPALVEQALVNILENAARFSPPGVAVEVVANNDADGRLCIEVRDHGPGIPEAERERIFDRFYSVGRGTDGRGDRAGAGHGTGLGLAISRGMVGAHGGAIQAVPTPGGGATLRITLPRQVPVTTTA